MSKPIALAFSDLHKKMWRGFSTNNDRLYTSLKPLEIIGKKAKKLGVPVLFTGDWDHDAKYVENLTNYEGFKHFKEFFEDKGIDLYAISGNHDFSERNNPDSPGHSHLRVYNLIFERFHQVDWISLSFYDKFTVHGIPYIDNNIGFKKTVKNLANKAKSIGGFNILLIHTNLHKAINEFGHTFKANDIPKDMNEFFKDFDLVLSGHIHKKQKLGENIYMLGAPTQQNRGDTGGKMGYWIIYKDKPPKFKAIKLPEFREINEGESIPDDGNYYTIIPIDDTGEISNKGIKRKSLKSVTKLVKTYLKRQGIKNKGKKRALMEILYKED